MPTTKTHLRAGVAIAALALPVFLGACGDDDADAKTEDPPRTTAEATTAPTAEAPGTLVLHAVDYGYDDAPKTVPAGTKLDLHNMSKVEVHEAVVFRLADDETRSAEELVSTVTNPEDLGEVVGVALAPPEADHAELPLGPIVLDKPGRYLVTCYIPTGVDPDAYMEAAAAAQGGPPDIQGGPPHVAQGMFTEIDVD